MLSLPRPFRTLFAAAVTTVVLAACTESGQTSPGSGSFDFVSPGGKTVLFYDPPTDRGSIGAMSGPDLMNDATVSVADFAGDIVVINVWGSWCAPCRTETPELETVHAEFQRRGVQFLGINVRDNRESERDFVTDRNVTYPSIFDPEMRSLIAFGRRYPTSVVPTTVVLDRQHRVAAVYLTAVLAEDLRPLLQRLTAES